MFISEYFLFAVPNNCLNRIYCGSLFFCLINKVCCFVVVVINEQCYAAVRPLSNGCLSQGAQRFSWVVHKIQAARSQPTWRAFCCSSFGVRSSLIEHFHFWRFVTVNAHIIKCYHITWFLYIVLNDLNYMLCTITLVWIDVLFDLNANLSLDLMKNCHSLWSEQLKPIKF